MATTINAGRVAMVPKGEWSASTAYVRLDVVQYNGSSYVATQDSTGQNPSTATTYWQLLASGVDPSNYYTKSETNTKLGSKQDALVSGQNIKTVNGQSVLGDGNLELGELFVVTMTQHNSVYTADKSVSEIYAASYTNGKPVIAVMRDINNPVFILTDCDPDGDSYVFSSIESNSVTTLRWQRTDDYAYELETVVLQPHLVSGTNIKTVNNETLLGGGNVDIVGKSAYQSYVDTTTDSPVKTEAEWVASLKGEDGVSLGEVAISDNLTTDDATKVLSARQGYELNGQINGFPAVTFVKSDYTLLDGLISTDIFRSNSVYGTKNKHVLIPFADYRGRTLNYSAVSGHYSNNIAFLTTNNLVSGETAPFCQGTTRVTSSSGSYVVPQDCSYLYVYAEREGSDSFPILSLAAVAPIVCSSTRADELQESIMSASRELGVININGLTKNPSATYTLEQAVAAVPERLRYGCKMLVYQTRITTKYVLRIAIFNSLAYVNGWTNLDNWLEFGVKDWSNCSEVAGAYKMAYTNVTSPSGNTTLREITASFDKMIVVKHSSDANNRWRILIRYTDGTNESKGISDEITTITPNAQKTVLGFAFVLMNTSSSCSIDADVLIGAARVAYENAWKPDVTLEEIGGLPSNQGIANAGKVLVVGSDGEVVAGENTPAGTLAGYGKIDSALTLYLKADAASEVAVGTGWSGSTANGYTHTSGNTDPLILGHTEEGKMYLVTLTFSNLTEASVTVKIGDGYAVDPYNGVLESRIGFVADGGDLTITPVSSYTGTIHAKLQEITNEETSVESVTISIKNFDAGLMVNDLTGFWNVAIGPDTQTMGKVINASRSLGIGYSALANLESGSRNIGVGTFALAQLKNGKGNIGIGADTYYRRQGGDDNVAIGRACMGGSTETVNNNVCIGRSAGERASGDDNVCIGVTAGYGAAGGCVHIGKNAGYSHDAGLKNIFIGFNSGYDGSQKTGSWNTVVGPTATSGNGVSKSTAVGYKASCTKSNQVVLGNYSSTAGDGTTETKVHGDLVVRGTDGISRRIVFNSDNTVTWEAVS